MSAPLISAVICTHNRESYLDKALRSLAAQTLPAENFEIILVNNGSTDGTEALVKREFSGLKNLRYIYEPKLGHSHAKNVAWKNAQAPYVAFLDDDAEAFPDWLEKILKSFEMPGKKPGCIGGKILPFWEKPRPSWMTGSMANSLGLLDWSDKRFEIAENQWLVGANIAFSKEALRLANGFDTSLGRKGTANLLSMEEIDCYRRIASSGYGLFYDPEIVVYHCMQASRLEPGWFIRRWYWQGVSEAVIEMRRAGRLGWLRGFKKASQLLRDPKLFSFYKIRKNPENLHHYCAFFTMAGRVAAFFGISRQR